MNISAEPGEEECWSADGLGKCGCKWYWQILCGCEYSGKNLKTGEHDDILCFAKHWSEIECSVMRLLWDCSMVTGLFVDAQVQFHASKYGFFWTWWHWDRYLSDYLGLPMCYSTSVPHTDSCHWSYIIAVVGTKYVRTYVCMYVCMHTYVHMYTCMYVHTYVCMYMCTYVYVCMYIHTYIHTYVCTYVCMYVHKYIRMYACTYLCMYICEYIRMYLHMRVSTYVHTNRYVYECNAYVCMYTYRYVCMHVCVYVWQSWV